MRSSPVRALTAVAVVACLALAGCSPAAANPSADPSPVTSCASRAPTPAVYVGVYVQGFPPSTTPLTQFQDKTGVRPSLITFYPRFSEDFFNAKAACTAIRRGATPVFQIDPKNISLAHIAAGKFDSYLRFYATAIKAFGARVVLSFGHEMNGYWYSWANKHTPPAVFVAAWRHIVTIFREVGADNVIWLWTVNVIDAQHGKIPGPAPWWPGSAYVNWVGIDGYYFEPSWRFVSLFGPTIVKVRELTHDPILITETGAVSDAGQPRQIADLFAGVRAYGLLGAVWFDATGSRDWRIQSPAAAAAFGQGAKTLLRRAS
jgi:mannan endo-1,4-beta-mannosidase